MPVRRDGKTAAPTPDARAMLRGVETKSVSPVFVGRSAELATLYDVFTRAGAGEPQALLIGGEAGVGKTRLVEEFAAAARDRGAVVAAGGCVEIGADGLPFAPFSTALRQLRRELPEQLTAAASGQEEELARLLPELGTAAARQARRDEQGMARLFELTARLLERVAAERTVVLVLEDLHWADASTRHLLAYLFRTLGTGRLVVLATYRSDDIHRRHPLRPLLAELDRLRTVLRVELGRFNREEVHRQIAGILAREPEPHHVDDIFERSDGNAFFVEELAVAAHEGCRTGLTDSLRDLLLVRVETLPENAQRVARIVAEGGSAVEDRLLAAVAGLGEDELIEALRAGVNASILTPAPERDGYRFRHSLVREAVSDDLLPGERSRLNRRFAEALEAEPALVPADERATRLASYWYHAHDAAKALPAVLDASVEARRRHAYAEQLRLLERAMELWDAVPDEVRAALRPLDHAETYPCPVPEGPDGTPDGHDAGGRPLRYLDLMAEAAVAGRLCGERERALKITKRALRLLDEDPDPLRAAWFWVQRSRLTQALSRGDGWDELGTARELVRGLPPSEVHAEVLASAAGWSMLHEPGADAMTAAERAVEYARMVGAHDIELNARLTLGGLMVDAGDIDTGLAELYEVKERATELGVDTVVARAFVNLPSVLEGVGRSEEAVRLLEEGVRVTRRLGLVDPEGWMWGNLAESLISVGRWDEAERAAASAQRPGQGAKPRAGGSIRLAHLAHLRGRRRGGPPPRRGPRPVRHPRPDAAVRPPDDVGRPPRRRRRGPRRRGPRPAVRRTGHRLPARHPALRLAPAARRRHGRGRPVRRPGDRGRPRAGPRPDPRRGEAPGHRSPPVDGPRPVAARRAAARRGQDRAGRVVRGRGRDGTAGAALRPRLRPPAARRGAAGRGRGGGRAGARHRTAAAGGRRRRSPRRGPAGARGRAAGPARSPGADARPARGHAPAGRPGRGARADQPGAGRPASGGRRTHQPPYRRGTVHLAEDGQRPRLEHPCQAGRLRPRRGGGRGPPGGPGPGRGRTAGDRATIGVGRTRPGTRGPGKGSDVQRLRGAVRPGRKHGDDERKRLELSREDVGDADPGRGPIDLASGKVTVRRPAPLEGNAEDASEGERPAG